MGNQEPRRILVVEDDESLRRVISQNLEARGYEVVQSDTAADALSKIVERAPHLIVLDILLPDRSGWDVLRRLERYQQEIPVVIVSAIRVSPERLQEFHPLAYLPKPFPLEALLRVVDGACSNGSTPNNGLATVEGGFF